MTAGSGRRYQVNFEKSIQSFIACRGDLKLISILEGGTVPPVVYKKAVLRHRQPLIPHHPHGSLPAQLQNFDIFFHAFKPQAYSTSQTLFPSALSLPVPSHSWQRLPTQPPRLSRLLMASKHLPGKPKPSRTPQSITLINSPLIVIGQGPFPVCHRLRHFPEHRLHLLTHSRFSLQASPILSRLPRS
jgi:hypothetical protein